MPMELTVVDAFTDRPFSGNPAAVAVLEAFPVEALMQAVAGEMNLSETAFVVRRRDRDYDLRWFTPSVEVELCGHATLAATHVLGFSGGGAHVSPGTVRFHTRSGVLTCTSDASGWIEMDFPSDVAVEAEVPAGLGLPGLRWYGRGKWDALAVLESGSDVRKLQPDLPTFAGLGTRSVIVTAAGDREGIDCVSRVFGPNVGVPEDPVTGSAHCTLAVFWSEQLGRESLVGEQASARGGIVRMRRQGDRVLLGGQAVTVSQVRLLI